MLKITPQNKEAGGSEMVVPGRRLWLVEDGSRLVEDGHPDARRLWCGPGKKVAASELARLMPKPEPPKQQPPPPEPEAAVTKAKPKSKSKATPSGVKPSPKKKGA